MITVRAVSVRVDSSAAGLVARGVAAERVTTFCRRTVGQAIVGCPVDTGLLRGRHDMSVRVGSSRVDGRVFNDAKYASSVHNGTSPHEIVGRAQRRVTRGNRRSGVKTLRFQVGGSVIFRRRVQHPGTRANPWLREAAKRVASEEGFRWISG